MHKLLLRTIGLGLAFSFACDAAIASDTDKRAARIVPATQAATIDYADGIALPLTPPGRSDTSQLRLVECTGYHTPLHVHPSTDESFFVVSGELSVSVNDTLQVLKADD